MVTAILFIVILSLLVFVHELGHFVFAKLSGMRVDEFGIGFPPRVFSWKKGETRYSVNLFPFGGFVKIHGEDQSAPVTGNDSHRSFGARPKILQALVLVAGVSFNVLFAWFLSSAGLVYGLPVSTSFDTTHEIRNAKVIITEVVPGSPANKAGLMAGDELPFAKIEDFQAKIKNAGLSPLVVSFSRAGIASSTTVTPVLGITNVPVIGVGLDAVGILSLPIHEAIYQGARLTINTVEVTVTSLSSYVYKALVQGENLGTISGPVGIAHLVGDARRLGVPYLITFTAFISVNLAVINLIPFPALDGGRLLFVAVEAITRRKIPAKISSILNTGGFALLVLLMVLVTYHDIVKLLVK